MSLRQRALAGELCSGTFMNLGSPVSVEIAGNAGFDWLLLDLEHGLGGYETLLHQLQALGGAPAKPLVRVQENNWGQIKKVLDYGAAGVMVPFVQSREDAQAAVANVKYHPGGVRGAARFTRACGFGRVTDEYLATANEETLTVVQIETPRAVANADAIASVDGVDVLFIGPFDLTVTKFGGPRPIDLGQLRPELEAVIGACSKHRKAGGILLSHPDELAAIVEMGFTFVAMGSDGVCLARGLMRNAECFKPSR